MTGSEVHPARLELLRPGQIYERVRQAPIAWLPLGALEWHGAHAPVGLDSVVAHELCLAAAGDIGGVVLPPVWSGLTGSIASHPWTILEDDPAVLVQWLSTCLVRLEQLGITHAIVVSGHMALTQEKALADIRAAWAARTGVMRLTAVTLADCPNLPVAPDHAGQFETALLQAFRPDLVDIGELGEDAGDLPGESPKGIQRRDPQHPLFGVLGPDPRTMPADLARRLRDHILAWLVDLATDQRS